MRKLAVVALVVTLVLVLVGSLGNRAAIAKAESDAARLKLQRDSLHAMIAQRDQQQARLTREKDSVTAVAGRLVDSVGALERRRAAGQLAVRQLRTTGALLDQLRATFPELGDSAWGLGTMPLYRGDTVGLEYLTLPAWFAETFVIDHANAESWRAQKNQLLAVDSLRLAVTALQDSILGLVAANAEAYQTGYQAAYAAHQDLTKRHIAELKKPRIRLGPVVGILGAAGLGMVAGRVLP